MIINVGGRIKLTKNVFRGNRATESIQDSESKVNNNNGGAILYKCHPNAE